MGCGGSTQKDDDGLGNSRTSSVVLTGKEALIVKNLRKVPVLTKLTNRQRKQLAMAMKEVKYKTGDVVFSEGDAGDAFYIIMEGKVKVVRQEVDLAHLMVGDYFGETALLTDAPRGASIIALEPLVTLMLDKTTFNEMFGDDALNVKLVKRMAISSEVKNDRNNDKETTDSPLAPSDAVREKSSKVRDLIYNAIKDSVLFSNYNRAHKYMVIDAMYRQTIAAGVAPIKEGEHGANLFVIEEGEFEETCTGNDESVSKGPGQLFGAKALMYSHTRNVTVTAVVESVVWKVDRYTFRRIGMDHGMAELEQSIGFLNQVELLGGLTSAERAKVAEALETVEFPSDHVIFREGEVGDAMYIVSSGECICTKVPTSKAKEKYPNKPCHESGDIIVATLKKTGVFGERALLTDEARAATVRTIIPTVCLRIDKESFQLLLGPLQDIMEKKLETYELKDEAEEENEDEGNQMEDISFSQLKHVGMLGQGSFGTVRLVQHKETSHTYALKGVSKQSIVENNQEEHIMSEKRVMMRFNHPFLVRLYNTYNQKDLLYFLLEPVLGGELFTLLRNKHLFSEPESIFYAGCVVLAFEYMHMKGTVYRDLKPENLLVDSEGYIQVTDFGFAKRIGDSKTWTLCGTPDYLCPEIVNGSGHGKGADWWTVGVLIYEMLTGKTPFYAHDQMDMFENIVRADVRFPSSMSQDAKSIIKGLLARKATKRLGSIREKKDGEMMAGAKLIKNHSWWSRSKVFDWEDLYHKKIQAPYKPKIRNNLDLRNFDQMEPEMPVARYNVKKSNQAWDADF